MPTDAQRYARVVRHFRRTRGVRRTREDDERGSWVKLAHQGREGVVYVDRDRTRVLKKVIVSLEEDPVTRFEASELANVAASARGICPKVHSVQYELDARGVLFFCIESDYFDGVAFDELRPSDQRKVAPLVKALARRMVRGGIWHGDLHGGNVLVRADLTEVTFVDFGNGCFCFASGKPLGSATKAVRALEALSLRKLDVLSGWRLSQ